MMKFISTDINNVFFTADTHFYHGNIIKYCPSRWCFMDDRERGIMLNGSQEDKKNLRVSRDTINRMNQAYVDGINNTVGYDDVLFILGDVGYFKEIEQVKRTMARLCVKAIYLVIGNHDNKQYMKQFFEHNMYDQREIKVNSTSVTLNHYAMLRWNKSHHGSYMLFGHSHGMLGEWIDEQMPNGRLLDVGVDGPNGEGHHEPWSWQEVKAYMDKKKGETFTPNNS